MSNDAVFWLDRGPDDDGLPELLRSLVFWLDFYFGGRVRPPQMRRIKHSSSSDQQENHRCLCRGKFILWLLPRWRSWGEHEPGEVFGLKQLPNQPPNAIREPDSM
jgi:hypothetical protein